MTDVQFQAVDSIGLSPSGVTFSVVATKPLLDTSGNVIRLPVPRSYEITSTPVTIALPSTTLYGAGWAYKVTWERGGRQLLTEFVSVPDSGSVVNYEDLTRVDPKTLTG